MDRHDLSGVTAEDVAKVHLEDLKVQDQYGCRALTYWFDENRGTAFCLVDAPNELAVLKMHAKAHGMIPARITEVNADSVNAFLGRIDNPVFNSDSGQELRIINESAHRAILILRIEDFPFLELRYGKENAIVYRKTFQKITHQASEEFDGNEIKNLHDCIIYSFKSVSPAITCATKIRQELKASNQKAIRNLKIKAGICSGDPVNLNENFFDHALQLANRLCTIASEGFTFASSEVRDELPDNVNLNKIFFLTPKKERFLDQLMNILESNWDKAGFDSIDFARKLGLSKSGLYRIISKICEYSPHNFIKEYRLQKSVEAIEKQEGNISEIAYNCGFNSPSYFSKCFFERFGVQPSALAGAIA